MSNVKVYISIFDSNVKVYISFDYTLASLTWTSFILSHEMHGCTYVYIGLDKTLKASFNSCSYYALMRDIP